MPRRSRPDVYADFAHVGDFHPTAQEAGNVQSAQEPGAVLDSLARNPDLDAVMSAAEILDFKTQAVRDIEAGRIKSTIEARLADRVRREALKIPERARTGRVARPDTNSDHNGSIPEEIACNL